MGMLFRSRWLFPLSPTWAMQWTMWLLAPKMRYLETQWLYWICQFFRCNFVTSSFKGCIGICQAIPFAWDTDALLPRQLPGSLARIPPGFSDNAQAMIWWGQDGAGRFQVCTDRMQRARHICSKGKLATWVPCDSPDALDSHFVLQNGALVEASQELRSYSSNICKHIHPLGIFKSTW